MHAPLLAREIVTAIAAGQAIAPLFIDLNRTHAKHPLWPGHARFHVVWQTFSIFFLQSLTVALIWLPSPATPHRFYLAVILTAIPMAGFYVALFSRSLYRGTLHDPAGIPPMRFHVSGRLFEIDGNAAIVIFATVLLAVAVCLF